MSLTRTTCPYCGVGCGVLAGADGTIQGDPEHPANFGRLCSKGSALGETIDLDGRLLHPQVRGAQASWDQALDLVADQFTQAIRSHGPDSVAFYVSGQLLTEDYYLANKLMKGFIGSANIDTNSRLCMASSVAGHKRAFGSDTVPGLYADLEEADVVVLVGSNLAWCHPVLFQRISAAKQARPAMQVINIDPRMTATSALADQHLQIAPDGDAALFNGLLAYLADHGAVNRDYVAAHVNGFDAALSAAQDSDVRTTGLAADDLQRFFETWTGAQKVVTVYSQGVNQSRCGTDKVNAILNCHLATGRIGLPGAGPFSVTGQPNAMGGREVGGLANMLANHLELDNPAHRAGVQRFWDSPTIADRPGLKAVDLFDACERGQIKALWVMSTNPAVSMPDAHRIARAIAAVPFVAVSDIMARTDTGDLADVLLPAAGWGEKSGTVTNSERRVSRQRPFLPTPGAARPDWRIIADVAARMGWASSFDYASEADVFAEYIALSQACAPFERDLDLSVFAGQEYDTLAPQHWPRQDHRFFAQGQFYHPDGKARMVPITAAAATHDGAFRLNTGRIRDQWHTMTRSGKSARLGSHLAEPYVEIHPSDAKRLGVGVAELISLHQGQQSGVFRALISDKVQPGTLFAPMHWTRQRSAGGLTNGLVPALTDPVSGQPALKGGSVDARAFEASWYGYLASASQPYPGGDYAALSKTRTGWQMELAGTEPQADWPERLAELLGRPLVDYAQLADDTQGRYRLVEYQDGITTTLLFVSPRPVQLSRAHVIDQIGTPPQMNQLAGRGGQDLPDPGALVCACMGVGVNQIKAAIGGGALDLQALGAVTGAGSCCGSCRPELSALLDAAGPRALAAE